MAKLKEYSVSIMGLKVEGISAENTENVRQALIIFLKKHPQIFEDKKSPEDIIQEFGLDVHETTSKKGKWAEAAKRLSEKYPITPEIDAALQKGIQEFRDGFPLGDIDINQK